VSGCHDITALRREFTGLETETFLIYLNTLPLSSVQPYLKKTIEDCRTENLATIK